MAKEEQDQNVNYQDLQNKEQDTIIKSLKDSQRIQMELAAEYGENRWQNFLQIREIVSNSDAIKKGLPVYYPAAGRDITYSLGWTDATELVFVDPIYIGSKGSLDHFHLPDEEIENIKGKINSVQTQGELGKEGKRIINFSWNDKERKLILYAEDATKFVPEELQEGAAMILVRGVDITNPNLRTLPEGQIGTPDLLINLYKTLSLGGFIHWKPTLSIPPEEIGFKQLTSFDKGGEKQGDPLYQKIEDVQDIEDLMKKDFDFLTQ